MPKQAFIASSLAISVALSQCALTQESPQSWYDGGRQTVERNLALRGSGTANVARNVILFVGDGMGVSTVTAARILEGQLRGETGEENSLSFEEFPNVALSKTYNTNAQVADSAGTMSAMASGIKTKAGLISVNQNVIRGDCDSQIGNETMTFLERAEARGLSTGVVSTARLTHATPAANYAHIMDRDFESDRNAASFANPGECADIARQLIEFPNKVSGSDGLEVALGGGRSNFIPASATDPESGNAGFRQDGRDLTREWAAQSGNSHYIWNEAQFNAIDPDETDHLLGLFQPSHMQYEFDRARDAGGEPSLTAMTMKAIDILAKNENGYFLQVESGRIDHGHHETNPTRALTDAIEFSNAIRAAAEKVDLSETLIIVTADHSHVFTIAGYPVRGNPILGKSLGLDAAGEPMDELNLAGDGLPYTTLGYANGRGPMINGQAIEPGSAGRADLTDIDTEHESFHPDVTVPMGSETHAGEDVAIYAIGPGSDLIRGVMEQNVIFHVMMEASQLEDR